MIALQLYTFNWTWSELMANQDTLQGPQYAVIVPADNLHASLATVYSYQQPLCTLVDSWKRLVHRWVQKNYAVHPLERAAK